MSCLLPYHHRAQWLNLWLTDFISCPDSHPCSEPFRHGLNYTPLSFLVLQDMDGIYWNVFSSVTTGANNSNLLLIFFSGIPWNLDRYKVLWRLLKLLEETKTAISPDLCSAFHTEVLSPRKSCLVRKYVFTRPCTRHQGGAHMVSRRESLNMYFSLKVLQLNLYYRNLIVNISFSLEHDRNMFSLTVVFIKKCASLFSLFYFYVIYQKCQKLVFSVDCFQ